ncbi:MAG: CPBP family intramembrane metalloprotease [Tidjanibacter sp.]|nr:CPBP family intramembrane metalloprotease [Tidjanibacter sp.]
MNNENFELNIAMQKAENAPIEEGKSSPTKEGKIAHIGEDKTAPASEERNVPLEGTQKAPASEGRKAPAGSARKFPTWVDLFATVGIFVLSSLVGSLVALVIMKLRGAENLTPDLTLLYYLVQMLPPIAYIVWLRRKAQRPSALHLGVRRVNLPILLWGVAVLLASSVVLEPLLLLFPKEEYQNVTDMVGLGGWAILSVVVCAPILEEILFRGLIFESCRERFGSGAAVLISALLFGLVHGVPVQIINAFVVGLIFGYIYLRTGSLLSVIILHAINNGIAYISLAFFGDAADTTLRDLIGPDWLYWTIYGLSTVVFVYAMVRLVLNLRNETELE